MTRGRTEKLENILKNVLSRKYLSGNFQIRRIQSLIESVLGKQKTKHIKVIGRRNKCLKITVDSSSMIYELEAFWKEEILKKIRESGDSSFTKIKFEIEDIK